MIFEYIDVINNLDMNIGLFSGIFELAKGALDRMIERAMIVIKTMTSIALGIIITILLVMFAPVIGLGRITIYISRKFKSFFNSIFNKILGRETKKEKEKITREKIGHVGENSNTRRFM